MDELKLTGITRFTRNTKHEGDYFLQTKNHITFWVKDPSNLLSTSENAIKSVSGELKVSQMQNGKMAQYLVLTSIDFATDEEQRALNGESEEDREEAKKANTAVSPDSEVNRYAGMNDNEIMAAILSKKKISEQINGNEFLNFRKEVVEAQRERQNALVAEVRNAKREGRNPHVAYYDEDPTYNKKVKDLSRSFVSRVSSAVAMGDNLGMLDRSGNYDINTDTNWGKPEK